MVSIIKFISILFFIICLPLSGNGQKLFSDQLALEVYSGDTVIVQKPAVIIDSLHFEKIRTNLLHYTELKEVYEENLTSNKKLVRELKSTQQKLNNVIDKGNLQADDLLKLNDLVTNLNALSDDMSIMNDNLASNNDEFNTNIEELELTNTQLKKEIRKLRFRNIRNYILAGLIGVAIGGSAVAIL